MTPWTRSKFHISKWTIVFSIVAVLVVLLVVDQPAFVTVVNGIGTAGTLAIGVPLGLLFLFTFLIGPFWVLRELELNEKEKVPLIYSLTGMVVIGWTLGKINAAGPEWLALVILAVIIVGLSVPKEKGR